MKQGSGPAGRAWEGVAAPEGPVLVLVLVLVSVTPSHGIWDPMGSQVWISVPGEAEEGWDGVFHGVLSGFGIVLVSSRGAGLGLEWRYQLPVGLFGNSLPGCSSRPGGGVCISEPSMDPSME